MASRGKENGIPSSSRPGSTSGVKAKKPPEPATRGGTDGSRKRANLFGGSAGARCEPRFEVHDGQHGLERRRQNRFLLASIHLLSANAQAQMRPKANLARPATEVRPRHQLGPLRSQHALRLVGIRPPEMLPD